VGRGLHELREVIEADLLVVGSSRRGLLGRVLIGDDTRAALNGAPCAVAIAPTGFASEPAVMRKVGVGYDGSPESAYGQPAEELAVYSASLDLLIVGSRGYGPIGRLIHGSTSQQLARSARCPLLVLTRRARAIEAPEAGEEEQETAMAVKG
jgi:nucleotide-binding universal stress UspA family protein